MKAILRTFFLLILCGSLIMTAGCASDTQSYDLASVSEIRENYSQSTEELLLKEFVNLDFSKAEFMDFPEIDSISTLSLGILSGKSAREIYDFFCESLDILMPGKYSAEVKESEIRFADGKRPEGSTSYEDFPTINEYELGENPFLMFKADDCFLDYTNGTLRWFDTADLLHWCGEDRAPNMETMDSANAVFLKYISDINSTEKYELINGEISIKDAVDFANNYLETMNFSPYELSAKTKVCAVNIFKIDGEKYGYNFMTTPEYKNVMFDYPEMMGGGMGISKIPNDYDNRDYFILPGQIDMIETDKVCHFISPAYNRSIEEAETYTSIITLENAADIVSRFYSNHMLFYVTRVQVVYLEYLNTAEPCWKFLMNCSGLLYNTFVNMHTGEVYVYIHEP